MDINDFLKQVKGLTDENKSESEKKTLTSLDFTPNSGSMIKAAREGAGRAYSVDANLAKKYNKYGLDWNPRDYYRDSLDIQLADAQSNWTKLGNALAQTLVSEIGLGTLLGFSDLFDAIGQAVGASDHDYNNPLTRTLEEWQYKFNNEVAPIYSRPGSGFENGTDFGWWMQNLPSIASSLTLLIPSNLIVGGLTKAGKALTTGSKFAKRWSKLSQPTRKMISDGAKIGLNAGIQRTLENYQEARQTYNQGVPEYKEELDKKVKNGTYDDFIAQHADILKNVDTSDTLEVAKAIARESADRTFQFDYLNTGFDILELLAIRNIPLGSFAKNKKSVAGRRYDINSRKFAGKYKTKEELETLLKNRNKWDKTKDVLKDIGYYGVTAGSAQLNEGVEEAINYVAQEEGLHLGRTILGTDASYTTFGDRLKEYLDAPALWESAFWGWMGGITFNFVASGGAKAETAVKRKKYEKELKEKLNIETGENTSFFDNRKQYFETADTYRIKTAIDARIADEADFYNKMTKLNTENKHPFFEDKTVDTEEEKEVLRQQLLQLRRQKLILNAMDSGTVDMLESYLQDENVQKAMVDAGIIKKEDVDKIQQEDLAEIKRIKERYKKYKKLVLKAAKNIYEDEGLDIPLEYLQLIVRNNITNELNAESLEKMLRQYEVEAEELNETLKNNPNYDSNIDYKTAVKLQVLGEKLGELQAEKQRILSDNELKSTFNGKERVRQLNTKIKNLKNTIFNLQPDNGVANLLVALEGAYTIEQNEEGKFVSNPINTNLLSFRKAITENNKKYFEDIDDRLVDLTDEHLNQRRVVEDRMVRALGERSDRSIRKISKELGAAYATIAALEYRIAESRSELKLTDPEILQEAKDLHNYLNDIRKIKVEESFEDIKDLAGKYGSKHIAEFISTYLHNRNNLYNIPNITEDDKNNIQRAIDILNLSAPINKNIEEDLYKILEDYDDVVAAQNIVRNQGFPTSENPNTSGQKSTTDNLSQQPQQSPTQPQNAPKPGTTKQPQAPTAQSANPTTTTGNSGLSSNITNLKTINDESGNYTYNQIKDDGYIVTFADDNKRNAQHYSNPNLFVQEQGVSLMDNNYIVIQNPIIDGKGNVDTVGVLGVNNEENQKRREQNLQEDINHINNYRELIDWLKNHNEEESSSHSSTGDEEQAPIDKDDVSEEEYQFARLGISIAGEANDMLLEIAGRENPIIDENTLKEIEDALNDRFNKENSEVIREQIRQEVAKIEATAQNLEIYKPVGQAINAALKAASIKETDIEGKRTANAIFNKAIDELINSNKDRLGFENVDGKTYINVESLLRFCNYVTNGKAAADILYQAALDYLQRSSKYVVVDNNPKRILNNIQLNPLERNQLERVSSYSINFDGMCNRVLTGVERTDAIKEINNLKLGDTIQYELENNAIVFTKNGTRIGYLPIPKFKPGTDHLMQVNDGWVTDVSRSGVPIKSDLKDLLLRWVENPTNDPDIEELYNIILAYAYETNQAEKEKLYDKFINNKAYKKAIEDGFTNDDNISIDTDPHEVRLNGLVKLWRYVKDAQYIGEDEDIANRTKEDNILNRSYGIETWFENMVKPSFNFVISLSNNKNGILTVSDVTEGDRIETTPEEALNPKAALGRKYKTQDGKIDIDKVKIGVKVIDTLSTSGNVNIDDTSLLSRSMTGSGNTFVVLLERNNSHEIIHAFPQKATSPNISTTANHLIKAIYNEFQKLVENVDASQDKASELLKMGNFLHDVFGSSFYNKKRGFWYNDHRGLMAPISGQLVVRDIYPKNSHTLQGFDLFSDSDRTFSIRLTDSNTIMITKTENGLPELINTKDLLDGMFSENAQFNIGVSFIESDNNQNVSSWSGMFSKEDGKFVVSIGTFKSEYKSYNDFILNEGLVTLSTKPDSDGYGNHYRFGENNGPIQTIKVKSDITSTLTTSPVEESKQTNDDFTITSESISGIINSNSKNKGFAIANLLASKLSNKKKFNNFYASLFPKNVIFVDENIGDLAYANTKNHDITFKDSKKTIIPSSAIVIGREWLDELVNSSEAGRKEAIRKLIHEQLHITLSKPDKRHFVEDIRVIFNEFARKNKDDKINIYLFNELPGHREKYYSHPVLDENGKPKLDETGKPIREITNEINEVGLEEFLVESITSGKLAEALNNIEADNKEEHKSLFSKIIDFLVKLFDWTGVKDIKEGSLYEQELSIINDIFGNTDNITKSKKETKQTKSKTVKPKIDSNQLSISFDEEIKELENEDVNESKDDNNIQPELDLNSDDDFSSFNPDDFDIPASSIIESSLQSSNYTSEMQQIKDQAIANGTFMKAPNGKPTNLTERQWLQVRTKAFKDWFGDWITAARLNQIENILLPATEKEELEYFESKQNEFYQALSIYEKSLSSIDRREVSSLDTRFPKQFRRIIILSDKSSKYNGVQLQNIDGDIWLESLSGTSIFGKISLKLFSSSFINHNTLNLRNFDSLFPLTKETRGSIDGSNFNLQSNQNVRHLLPIVGQRLYKEIAKIIPYFELEGSIDTRSIASNTFKELIEEAIEKTSSIIDFNTTNNIAIKRILDNITKNILYTYYGINSDKFNIEFTNKVLTILLDDYNDKKYRYKSFKEYLNNDTSVFGFITKYFEKLEFKISGKTSDLADAIYESNKTDYNPYENIEPSSKVVDENGEPLVVYHGSNNKFNEFAQNVAIYTTTMEMADSYYYSEINAEEDSELFYHNSKEEDYGLQKEGDYERALLFLNQDEYFLKQLNSIEKSKIEINFEDFIGQNYPEYAVVETEDKEHLGTVYDILYDKIPKDKYKEIASAFAESQHPSNIVDYYKKKITGKSYALFIDIKNPLIIDAEDKWWDEIDFNGEPLQSTRDIEEYAIKHGYDGFIVYNVKDYGGYVSEQNYVGSQNIYVAFNGNQTKSATDNNGEFSRENNDIYDMPINDIESFVEHFPTSQQASIASRIFNGEISIKC